MNSFMNGAVGRAKFVTLQMKHAKLQHAAGSFLSCASYGPLTKKYKEAEARLYEVLQESRATGGSHEHQ